MDDWRKNLDPDELREVDLEDQQIAKTNAAHLKRARDAMRMACKRAGPAMPKWLSVAQKKEMLLMYFAAQKLGEIRGEKFQVDHIVPIHGRHTDNIRGADIHYICGLHIPKNLRIILARHNRERSDNLYTAEPLIVPDEDIPF